MSYDGAREFVTAYMRKGRGQPRHLPSGEHGVGMAVRCGFDADEEVIWVGWCRYRFSCCEMIRCIVAAEVLGTHLRREISSCHCVLNTCGLVTMVVLTSTETGLSQFRIAGLDWGAFGCMVNTICVASE